jgi:hypothetical protein
MNETPTTKGTTMKTLSKEQVQEICSRYYNSERGIANREKARAASKMMKDSRRVARLNAGCASVN